MSSDSILHSCTGNYFIVVILVEDVGNNFSGIVEVTIDSVHRGLNVEVLGCVLEDSKHGAACQSDSSMNLCPPINFEEVGLPWLCDPEAPSERVQLGYNYQSHIFRTAPRNEDLGVMDKSVKLQVVRDFLHRSTAEEIIREMIKSIRQTMFFKGLRQLEYQRHISTKQMLFYTDQMKNGYVMYCQEYNYPDLLEDEFTELLDETFGSYPNLDLEVEKSPPDPFPVAYGVPTIIFGREKIIEKREKFPDADSEGPSSKRKHRSFGSREKKKMKMKKLKKSSRSSDT